MNLFDEAVKIVRAYHAETELFRKQEYFEDELDEKVNKLLENITLPKFDIFKPLNQDENHD